MAQYKLGFYEAGALVGTLPEEGFIENKADADDLLIKIAGNKSFVRIAGQNVWFDSAYTVSGEPPRYPPEFPKRAVIRKEPLPPLFMRKRMEEGEDN